LQPLVQEEAKMKLQEIKRSIEEFKKKHQGAYAKIVEEEVKGEVKFVELMIRFKVDNEKKSLDFCK
jgi:hypothetical protein